MNINDYIKDATSKIFDAKEKRKVEAELTDHILKHKEFNEEIGYDAKPRKWLLKKWARAQTLLSS